MYRRKRLNAAKALNRVVDFLEMAIAIALIAGMTVLFVELVVEYVLLTITQGVFDFNAFLSKALNLIIGIEFIRILCSHSLDIIIEVLMFTAARQLIMVHSGPLDTLLGIVSIGILFAIRRYMFYNKRDIGHHFGIYSFFREHYANKDDSKNLENERLP